MRHIFRCHTRWGDMDAFAHINNVAYLTYLEEARVDLLVGSPNHSTSERTTGGPAFADGIVVARAEIDYLAPLVFDPRGVAVEVWVEKIAGSSFTLAYAIRDDERLHARAKTVMVAFDLTARRPRRLSPDERAYLAAYCDESPSPRLD